MKQKIFRHTLGRKNSWSVLAFSALSFILGMVALLFALQFYVDVKTAFTPQKDEEKLSYLIVSKEIGLMNTLTGARANFSTLELEDIKTKDFIHRVGDFKTNQFEVWTTGNHLFPIKTELFFESVPTDMLDVQSDLWRWKEGDVQVPVLLSKDFLSLYNFGYALVRGLPQVPASMATLAPAFQTEIYSAKGKKSIQLKLVGFTERIPSILVPAEFMDWANKELGSAETAQPSRLLLEVKDPANPDLIRFLQEKNYVVRQDAIEAAKVVETARWLLSILGAVGVLFMLLSAVLMLTQTQNLMLKVQAEIKLLLLLGYAVRDILLYLWSRFVLGMIVYTLLALGVFIYFYPKLLAVLAEKGLALTLNLSMMPYLVSLAFLAFSLLWGYASIRWQIKQQQ